MSPAEFVYEGGELELFRHAKNWKRYWSAHITPYLGRRVLEVGAGTGINTPYLNTGSADWTCLEPDGAMAFEMEARHRSHTLTASRVLRGTILDLPETPDFDSIVYIDVLEHIKDDAAEVAAAARRLRAGGTLIVLSPAYGWLFSRFDEAIGHYRRYSRSGLQTLTCSGLRLVVIKHLDAVGVVASAANRFLLRPQTPTLAQIKVWDRVMVPISRLVDPVLAYRVGKSIIAVWRRE